MMIGVQQQISAQRINRDSLWSVWIDSTQKDSLRLEALHTIAGYGYLFTKPDSAYYYAQIEYDYAKSKGLKYHMGNALHTQGMSFMYSGAFDSAITYYNRSINLRKEINDKQGIAGSLNNIGNIYHEQDDYENALGYYKRSLKIKKELGDKKGMSKSINNIGIIYENRGDYAKAIEYFMKSLALKEAIGDKKGIAGSLNNIGILYSNQEEYEKSFEFHKRSLLIKEEIDDQEGVAASLNSIALYYKRIGNYEKAMDYQKRSLQIFKRLRYKRGIGVTLNNMGLIHMESGELAVALEYFFKSLTVREELNDNKGLAGSLINIGGIYLLQNEFNRAIYYNKKALNKAQEIGSVKQSRDAAQKLYKAYKSIGNKSKALEAHELFMQAKDSINSEGNRKGIIRQEYKYEYDKQKLADSLTFVKQKEIDELAHLSVLDKEANIRYGLYLGLGFLTVLGIVLYRSYQRKKKDNVLITQQKNELSRKNEEKTAMLKEIHHRVKNNLQVVNSLLKLQSREVEDKHIVSMFKEAQNRVLSMALLHEKMYRSDDLKHIDVKDHINLLVEDLIKSYVVGKVITLNINIEALDIGIRTLVPLGLIINEMITNALKYAFKDKNKGEIIIHIKPLKNDSYEMIIGDNGVGLKEEKESKGIGTKLIQIFTKQLNGKLEHLEQPGTLYKLVFEKID